MTGLDDDAAGPSHGLHPLLHTVGDEADQCAGDENADQGHQEGEQAATPPDIARHRAGVEDTQHALPEILDP